MIPNWRFNFGFLLLFSGSPWPMFLSWTVSGLPSIYRHASTGTLISTAEVIPSTGTASLFCLTRAPDLSKHFMFGKTKAANLLSECLSDSDWVDLGTSKFSLARTKHNRGTGYFPVSPLHVLLIGSQCHFRSGTLSHERLRHVVPQSNFCFASVSGIQKLWCIPTPARNANFALSRHGIV